MSLYEQALYPLFRFSQNHGKIYSLNRLCQALCTASMVLFTYIGT